MSRSLLTAAILAAVYASAGCGGDAFTAGSGDAGSAHDAAVNDSAPSEASPVDAFTEPPPTCSGAYACVPAVPAGWEGPIEVYAGTAPPPMCTSGFAQSVDAHDMLQAPAATCGCTCGASAITCNAPALEFYGSMTCNATPVICANASLSPGACVTLDERSKCATPLLDVSIPQGSAAMGPCAPQATKNVPVSTWATQARGCASTVAPAQVNCTSGQICAPTPGAGFAAKLCVSHDGDVACPGAGYGVKHLYFTGVDDTRSCSDCNCAAPNGGSCSYTFNMYQSSDSSCTNFQTSFAPGVQCGGVASPADFRLDEKSVAGTCGASTSSPTGLAVPSGPVTVCCPL